MSTAPFTGSTGVPPGTPTGASPGVSPGVPLGGPPGVVVRLPIGPDSGEAGATAVVRKMRGHEEALLHDPDLGPAALVSHLLAGTALRIGECERPGVEAVEAMYSADRNHLLLQVRRLTLGDRLAAVYACPACAARVRVIERLDELPFVALEETGDPEAVEVTLEDGWTDREGTTHTEVVLRLPRGSDEQFVTTFVASDPVAAADALLLRCVVRFGSVPSSELDAFGLRILRDLTLGDRARLQRALHEDAPGTRMLRGIECTDCGARFERQLDVTDFFVAGREKAPDSNRRSSTWPGTSTGAGATS